MCWIGSDTKRGMLPFAFVFQGKVGYGEKKVAWCSFVVPQLFIAVFIVVLYAIIHFIFFNDSLEKSL